MDETKYGHAAWPPPADEAPGSTEPGVGDTPPQVDDQNAASPAVEKFQSCRWRATPDAGDYCTHRDVLPFAGKEGFNPESWCPECGFYKLRRTPKKRERNDYMY
ncbi:MAG TPA: hypothetical protein VFJ02_10215 [Vicinamibacterales bacterium]|nr:hypothetical protein [Vicinamibacterales bacterium]